MRIAGSKTESALLKVSLEKSEYKRAANEATVMPIEIATPPRYGTGSF
jgi:hypothetical protein